MSIIELNDRPERAATGKFDELPEALAASDIAIRLENVNRTYRTGRTSVTALDGISLNVHRGSFTCIVGASGCGKSTLLNLVAGLDRPTAGKVTVQGRTGLMFQESALFPWLTVAQNVALPLKLRKVPRAKRAERVAELLDLVHLSDFAQKRPHELSGGMRQRVCIAIGILLKPKVIIADEPTSALDVVTQRQVMETINRVQQELGCAVILIGHDMGLMAQSMDKVAVMYAGKLVEISTVRQMFTEPFHPYSQALIHSLPNLDNKGVLQGIPGLAPSLLRIPSGCAFHPRCTKATERCKAVVPTLRQQPDGRFVSCLLYEEDKVTA